MPLFLFTAFSPPLITANAVSSSLWHTQKAKVRTEVEDISGGKSKAEWWQPYLM